MSDANDTTRTLPTARHALTVWLERAPASVLVLYAITTSFSVYFCMYAFRKPFSAGTYEGLRFLGTAIELKTAFVIAQVLGYALSKYVGIKVCAEVTRERRASLLVRLILVAEGALLLFAVMPPAWKVLAIFASGLPLGMVWGLVVWYLEGRRTSELLLAGLSASFILSSGVVKDVGLWLMGRWGVAEFWMPFVTGLVFLPLFFVSSWLLDRLPEPTAEDHAERSARHPMDAGRRGSFLKEFLPGLVLLFLAYFLLTAYRDFRDNYGVEIFEGLGYGSTPAIFTRSETWVALGVLVPLALLTLVRDNRRGLLAALLIMAAGTSLMGLASLLFDRERISGLTWMVLVGMGSYLAYVPFGSVLFDRMMASTRVAGTAVFAIYVADALGYTGSVGIQIFRDVAFAGSSRLEFFRGFTLAMSMVGTVLLLASALYFHLRAVEGTPAEGPPYLTTKASA